MKKNKILALFLAMVMLLSLGTLAVSASDEEVTATEISTAEELYDFMTSTSGDDVYGVLVNDIIYDTDTYGVMNIQGEKDLDLGGYTITVPDEVTNYSRPFYILDNSVISIYNGSFIAGVETDKGACGMLDTKTYATNIIINIHDLYLSANYRYSLVFRFFDGVVATLEDCVFDLEQTGAILSGCATVNVSNCTITGTEYYDWNSSAVAVQWGDYGPTVLNVYSGTYSSDGYGAFVFSSGGEINIYGGEWQADLAVLKADNSSSGSTINVYGGTFDGAISIGSTSTLAIEGGTFANTGLTAEELSVYVTNEDYQVVALADGSLGVVEETCTIDFVANNDTTIDSISGEYGAAITMPTDPTLDGYTFTGWYTDADCTAEFTDETFTSTATLYAGWEEIVVEEEDEFDFFAFWQMIVDFFQRIYDYFYVIIN